MSNFIPSLDYQKYIDMCYEIARDSTCSKARYGAVIVALDFASSSSPNREFIVGKGTNHSPNPACEDCAALCAGGIRAGIKSGTRLELCYAVHAEQWALLQAGPLAKNGTMFVAGLDANWEKMLRKDPSLPPGHPNAGFYCSMCARLMWAAGVKYIVRDTVWDIPIVYSMEEAWASAYAVAGSV